VRCLVAADSVDPYAERRRLPTCFAAQHRVLKDAGLPATVFGAEETTHTKINADLGQPDDPATKVLFEFLAGALKK